MRLWCSKLDNDGPPESFQLLGDSKQLIRGDDYFQTVCQVFLYLSFLEQFVCPESFVNLNCDSQAFSCLQVFNRLWSGNIVLKKKQQWKSLLCCSLIAPLPSFLFSLSPPQTWFSAQMRWMWTSLSWLTHCLRGPPTPAGWSCLSHSSPHTTSWSTAMRWDAKKRFITSLQIIWALMC